MKTRYWVAGALLISSSTLVLAGPTSLLPPGFEDPTPAPTPAPAPAPTPTPRPAPTPGPSQGGGGTSQPVIQSVPAPDGSATSAAGPEDGADAARQALRRLPSLEELESMSASELDEALGLTPDFDVPPTARRSLEMVGVIAEREGGFPGRSLTRQPASLVRAAIAGNDGRMVSRWGHILMRRALASRLDAPESLGTVEFAALRAALLNRMGEAHVARSLVQDVDTANFNAGLAAAALDAAVSTGDIVGICPVVRLKGDLLESTEWTMASHVCGAFANEERRALRDLDRMLSREQAPRIDVLLAQRFAGAAGEGRRAVNIEWDDVEELTPWRYGLATALGVAVPDNLWDGSRGAYAANAALSPAMSLDRRLSASGAAAARGVMSSKAMIDLYGAAYEEAESVPQWGAQARLLRNAYVAADPAQRLTAIKSLWSEGDAVGADVLTAYAAARMSPSDEFSGDAAMLIASMLQAGLDRNAMRWASVVDEGSEAWALLALAQPQRSEPVSEGSFRSFYDSDESADYRKSQFLLAGLAGLGRLEQDAFAELASDMEIDFGRSTRWSELISKSAAVDNPTLVALLAGVGMQGEGWDKMTPRHLYHIVKALNDVGLSAEARMIAAEAVAKG